MFQSNDPGSKRISGRGSIHKKIITNYVLADTVPTGWYGSGTSSPIHPSNHWFPAWKHRGSPGKYTPQTGVINIVLKPNTTLFCVEQIIKNQVMLHLASIFIIHPSFLLGNWIRTCLPVFEFNKNSNKFPYTLYIISIIFWSKRKQKKRQKNSCPANKRKLLQFLPGGSPLIDSTVHWWTLQSASNDTPGAIRWTHGVGGLVKNPNFFPGGSNNFPGFFVNTWRVYGREMGSLLITYDD